MVCGNFYADFLSSNLRQVSLGILVWMLKPFPFSSCSILMTQITSLREFDSLIYSASLVLSVIKYCILLAHIIIPYPVFKWLDIVLSNDQCFRNTAKSASTYHSNPLFFSGLKVMPCALFFNKYLHTRFTASF